MNEIIKILEKDMNKAIKKGEVPVSAVIVMNGKIISHSYNQRERNNDVLGHAEILAIKKACKKLKTWILSDCEMFVTLEPCTMCKEIIKQSRIKNVNYFLGNNKMINYKTNFKKIEIKEAKKYENILKSFFENRRK